MIYFELFITFIKIGIFSFGGGYAMIPLIQQEVVVTNKWISSGEFLDMISVAQITPGPIAINSATFAGYRVGGILGSIVATIGVVIPSIILIFGISFLIKKIGKSSHIENLYKGLRPIVLALIFSAVISVGKESLLDIKAFIIFLITLILLQIKRINMFLIIFITGFLGYILY